MNIETINEIQDKLAQVSNEMAELKKELIALKVDKATTVKSERKIRPGTACKVSYNASGLVTNQLDLEVSDIPTLPMSKISGLSEAISDMTKRAELDRIYDQLDSVYKPSEAVKTGIKVNVDKRGLVTGVADLLPSDIPELPISKIEGLQNIIDHLQSYTPSKVSEDTFNTRPGTACKVSWDTKGRIVKSSDLRVEDIPKQILDRINTLEGASHTMAYSADIERIDSMLTTKISKPHSIESGIFTKVVVNSDGLVTKGSQLTKADIPQLTIEDIPNLLQQLASKATKDDIAEISDKISQLSYNIKSIPNIPVPEATNQEELNDIKHQLSQLTAKLETKPTVIPDITQILAEINNIKNEVMTLSGRISVLESKM